MQSTQPRDLAAVFLAIGVVLVLFVLSLVVGVAAELTADPAALVVEPLQVPRPGDPVEVDEGEPVLPDDLDVVARDRLAPPRLLDPPADCRPRPPRAGRSSGSR